MEPTDKPTALQQFYVLLARVAGEDVEELLKKNEEYGDSWKKRGGIGAFMMLARKWDRIENMTQAERYDVFEAILKSDAVTGVVDDIGDLRRYLLLVETECRLRRYQQTGANNAPLAPGTPQPTSGPVALFEQEQEAEVPTPLPPEHITADDELTRMVRTILVQVYGNKQRAQTEAATSALIRLFNERITAMGEALAKNVEEHIGECDHSPNP